MDYFDVSERNMYYIKKLIMYKNFKLSGFAVCFCCQILTVFNVLDAWLQMHWMLLWGISWTKGNVVRRSFVMLLVIVLISIYLKKYLEHSKKSSALQFKYLPVAYTLRLSTENEKEKESKLVTSLISYLRYA